VQLDFLTWLMDEAKGEEATDWYLTTRILTVNFTAIHTSSMVCRVYHTDARDQFSEIGGRLSRTHFIIWPPFPEYMKPLREEVEEIIPTRRLDKGSHRSDVQTRQLHQRGPKAAPCSQPVSPCRTLHTLRKLMHSQSRCSELPLTTTPSPTAHTVPRGTTIGVSLDNVHLNDKIYPDALTFDPFRFVKLKEQDPSGRKFDMTTNSIDSLSFGHGRHACPGRYFAASELKLMFAHVVTNYDVKLENEGVRPRDLWIVGACVPNPNAKVLFRKRVL
jgi:hypothetical protein